jgi:hypothetical protein
MNNKPSTCGDSLVIYLVPHAHYDIDYPDAAQKQLDRQIPNIKKRLEYMRGGSTQTYTFDGTYELRNFLQRHPEEADFLKQMIREGRIDMPGDITGCEMTITDLGLLFLI